MNPESFLPGGGEMGALIRATDWSRTPVGPVDAWPQSLRTVLSIMLESRFGMYIAWGPDYTQFYNDPYRPILGSTKHPAAGKSARETFAESWHIIGPLFDQVMGGQAVGSDDWMLPLDRHGYLEECYFTFSYSPIRDETGGVGGVLVTVAESTERVLAERRLRTLRDLAARAAETTSVDDAWRRALDVLAANPLDLPFAVLYEVEPGGGSARRLGAPGLAADSEAAPEIVRLDGDDADGWPLARVARTGAAEVVLDVRRRFGDLPGGPWPEPPETAVALPVNRPGLEWPYGLLVAGISPRRALDESYRELLTLVASHIATAVSNARSYEEERSRAEALAEIDRAKTLFFSNVSHEFRTPLTLILGPVEDLLSGHGGPLSEAQREEVEVLRRNALRLLKLVNTLLDFSRIEAGRVQVSYAPTDLARLTADLASSFRSAIERAGLRLEVDCPPLPEPVYVDRDMWEKIVLNLVSNAFKFTFAGTIRVALAWRGDRVELTVSDTGTGIAPGELPHIFERFHRVQGAQSRSYEGSGIGLSMVRELVHLHGGEIEVASVPEEGTTLKVSLPAGSAHLPGERLGAAPELASTALGTAPFVEEALRWLPDLPDPEPVPAVPGETGRARILVADDNADMRDYLVRLLGDRWEVEAAADGRTALAAILEHPPDLVLADVMMPGLDGFELLRALRTHPRTGTLPVMLVSARAGEEARLEGLAAGADDYVVKPFSARELVARVASQLALQRARSEADTILRQMFDLFLQAPVPVCVLRGPDFVYEVVNPLYDQLTGHRGLIGRTLAEAIPEAADQGFVALMRGVLETGVAAVQRESLLRFDRLGEGRLEDSWWTFIYAPLRNPQREIDRVMVLCLDVTEQVRVRAEREELLVKERSARRESEAANRAKDEFLAMLGHELRNPLSPILTALEIMRLRDASAFERERSVIDRQVRHLVGLVDDLLDVSRITRGKVDLKRRRVELAAIVAKAIEMASPLFEQKHHVLRAAVPAAGLEVDGDEVRLAQIVANLLMNAAKYTEREGVVEVTAEARDGQAVLTVADSGIGIPPDLLPRLFGLFVQGERSIDRTQGGLGLGLAIVKSLTELHGGSVEAHSDGSGQGSRFVVRLPLAVGVREDSPIASEDGMEPLGVGRRILVVDDNRDAAEMLAELLASKGHEVQVAEDGPTALAVAGRFRPEVALLDIGLPVMDGYELAARLRELSAGPLRLIAVTGYGQEEDRERARAAGFHGHLVKPIDPAVLRERVERPGAGGEGDF